MRDLSIRLKLTLVVLAIFVAGSAMVIVVLDQMYSSMIDVLAEESLQESQNSFARLESASIDKLEAALDAASSRDDLRSLFQEGDRDGLYEAALPLFEQLREDTAITHWYFETASDASVFLRVHNPDKYGDPLSERWVYTQAVETQGLAAGKELGQTAFALRATKPYVDDSGEVVGYVEMGQEIDEFLSRMHEDTGDDFAMLLLKEHLDRDAWASVQEVAGVRDTWDDDPDTVIADSTLDVDLMTEIDVSLESLPPRGLVLGVIESAGSTFVRAVYPVSDASGRRVGGVLVLSDISDVARTMATVRRTLLLVGAVLGFAGVAGLLVLLRRLIFARLDDMTARLEDASARVIGGDFSFQGFEGIGPRDEIGRFEEFFAGFLRVVARAFEEFSKRR